MTVPSVFASESSHGGVLNCDGTVLSLAVHCFPCLPMYMFCHEYVRLPCSSLIKGVCDVPIVLSPSPAGAAEHALRLGSILLGHDPGQRPSPAPSQLDHPARWLEAARSKLLQPAQQTPIIYRHLMVLS